MKKNDSPGGENCFRQRVKSFGYALQGILNLLSGPNFRLQLLAAAIVIILGITRHLEPIRWAAIVLAVGLVLVAEGMNTAVEKLSDFSCKGEWREEIKVIKDIAAGAVLIAALASVAIAGFVFLT